MSIQKSENKIYRAKPEGYQRKQFPQAVRDIDPNSFDTWLGFAFERFGLKHAGLLALVMDFADDILLASPYFNMNDESFQIDLLYKRADRVIYTSVQIASSRYAKSNIRI